MERPARVVQYLNQFFAGIGGEEKANEPVRVIDGPAGPGRALERRLGEQGAVVATVVCGDNYFNDHKKLALERVGTALKRLKPDVVVAGPAFEAGRYGLACGAVCKLAGEHGIPALAAMHPQNPGVESFRAAALIVPTGPSAAEMQAAIERLTPLALKLAAREAIGPASQEGYLPRGNRKLVTREEPGYKRAVDMLAAKLKGQPFQTEIPVLLPERVKPAAPVADMAHAVIAMVTTGGLVRKGNPEKQVASNARVFHRHSVAELEALTPDGWEAYHSGYFNHIVNSNPNYILPLSFLRDLEKRHVIGGVHGWIYALPGVSTPVAQARELGKGVASDLKRDRVDACLLVST